MTIRLQSTSWKPVWSTGQNTHQRRRGVLSPDFEILPRICLTDLVTDPVPSASRPRGHQSGLSGKILPCYKEGD